MRGSYIVLIILLISTTAVADVAVREPRPALEHRCANTDNATVAVEDWMQGLVLEEGEPVDQVRCDALGSYEYDQPTVPDDIMKGGWTLDLTPQDAVYFVPYGLLIGLFAYRYHKEELNRELLRISGGTTVLVAIVAGLLWLIDPGMDPGAHEFIGLTVVIVAPTVLMSHRHDWNDDAELREKILIHLLTAISAVSVVWMVVTSLHRWSIAI